MYYLLSSLLEKSIGKLKRKKRIMKNLSVGRNVGIVPEKDILKTAKTDCVELLDGMPQFDFDWNRLKKLFASYMVV